MALCPPQDSRPECGCVAQRQSLGLPPPGLQVRFAQNPDARGPRGFGDQGGLRGSDSRKRGGIRRDQLQRLPVLTIPQVSPARRVSPRKRLAAMLATGFSSTILFSDKATYRALGSYQNP